MTTELPEPGDSSVDDHVQMSRRFLEHAYLELAKGDRVQASEKVWGAAAHALKAIAKQRGWLHYQHSTVLDVGEQLAREFGREDEFGKYLNSADAMHKNFYENVRRSSAIRIALRDVEKLVDELDGIRNSPPRPFTVADDDDRGRLGALLGVRRGATPSIGTSSPVGFSQTHRNGESADSGEDDARDVP